MSENTPFPFVTVGSRGKTGVTYCTKTPLCSRKTLLLVCFVVIVLLLFFISFVFLLKTAVVDVMLFSLV